MTSLSIDELMSRAFSYGPGAPDKVPADHITTQGDVLSRNAKNSTNTLLLSQLSVIAIYACAK